MQGNQGAMGDRASRAAAERRAAWRDLSCEAESISQGAARLFAGEVGGRRACYARPFRIASASSTATHGRSTDGW
jgi:hypothetical protein